MIRSIVLGALLSVFLSLGSAQFGRMGPGIGSVQALCAKPRARIDLVLPPVDFVQTYSTNVLVGATFKFEVTFDNLQGNNTGYGPYIDVIFPASGGSGFPYDGVSFLQSVGATYAGTQIIATPYIFGSSTLNHPFTNASISGAPGDQLVVIELPFSSYTPQQPPASVIVNAQVSNLANINQALPIRVQAGFRYGCSGMGNGGAVGSAGADNDSGTVIPVLFTIDKSYDGPEFGPKMGETVTGPNFPHHYTISVNVAPGQTIAPLTITDLLADNLAFKGMTSIYPSNGQVVSTNPVGVPAYNNLLIVTFPSILGTGGTPTQPDVQVVFEFFIPDKDASGAWVLDPNTGAPAISENDVKVEGNWTPLDPRDPGGVQTLDPSGPEYTLTCKSIALQKKGENTSKGNADVTKTQPPTDNAPGDIILNTLNFQVSDYFTFNQLSIDDLVSDGQSFLTTPAIYTPNFSVTDQQHNASGNFTTANLTVTTLPCTGFPNGRTRALFTLAGSMTGGYALTTSSTVPATGRVQFFTRIEENYACPPLSGDVSVDQNDKLFNRATLNGTILNNATQQAIGPMQDDAQIDFKLLLGLVSKSVFAHTDRNGVQTLNLPANKLFAPGDKIAFRLTYKLPHGDIENFSIADFLPMPLLKATQLSTSPLVGCTGGNPPPVNTACFQPGSLNLTGKPVVTIPPITPINSLNFDYGTFDDPTSPVNGKLIDFLFTLEIQNDPFVDGLFMANQLQSIENNSFLDYVSESAAAQFKVGEPKLRIRKGVVATNNTAGVFSPAVTPPYNNGFNQTITSTVLNNPNAIHSNLSNVDASDLVTFTVIVENTGSSPYGAFDVRISDTLPPGFIVPGGNANLAVNYGNGPPIPFTGTAATFFTPAGIELTDPSLTAGSLKPPTGPSGTNIAVITYTLQIDPQIGTCQKLSNTATISNYASAEQGPNFADPVTGISGQYSDTRSVAIGPTISKTLVSTNQPYTLDPNVTIGEEVAYEIKVNLPEGLTPSLTITDPVPPGLQVTWVGPISSSYVVPTPTRIPTVLPGACGAPLILTFGAINVPINNNPNDNWFRFQVKARVCDVPSNIGFGSNQTSLGNIATVTSGACQSISSPATVTVVEPRLAITKQFTPATVQVNGTVQIGLTVTNTGTSPAFEVVVDDPLPTAFFSGITPVTTPLGWAFSTSVSGSNTIVTYTAGPGRAIPPNGTVTFRFNAIARQCGPFVNTATISKATTLFGAFVFERNEPATSATASVVIKGPPCPCVQEPPGLADWWAFDELSGSIAGDRRLTNNVGAYGPGNMAPTPTTDGPRRTLCFDGNDYVAVGLPTHPEINFSGNCSGATESFTIDVWVKTGLLNTPIIDKRANPGPIGYYLFLSGGHLGFQMNGSTFISTNPNIADNNWHFVAVTVARCSGAVGTLYVDGLPVLTFTPPGGSLVNASALQFGRNVPSLGTSHLRGCLDELEIFKRALSPTEIQVIYGAEAAGKCK